MTIFCASGPQLGSCGSPHSARRKNRAFQYPRSQDAWAESVSDGIDMLITHSPSRVYLEVPNLGCMQMLPKQTLTTGLSLCIRNRQLNGNSHAITAVADD